MSTGGWLIFSVANDGDMDWNRGMKDYMYGFRGDGATWLGLEPVYQLCKEKNCELRLKFSEYDKNYVAYVDNFYLEDGSTGYVIRLSSVRGPDEAQGFVHNILHHDGARFSANDTDNDESYGENCANTHKSGWWYRECYTFKFIGDGKRRDHTGMNIYWGRNLKNIHYAEMALRVQPKYKIE